MKRLITLLLGILFCTALLAENYPYRADYLWVTVPDHADWLYKTGEKATVEVQFYKYGIPRDGVFEYDIANDMLEADAHGSVTLKGGRATINTGTRKDPGFRDLRLKMVVDGVTYSHHVKLGFGVDRIRPFTQEPADFEQFWKDNIAEAEKCPLTYTKEQEKEYCTDKVDCYLVKLMLNSSQGIYGYLFYPKDAQPGKHPVVLCPPGAGIKTIKEPLKRKYYAENGFIRMEMEIHGMDPRMSTEKFNEISAAFNGRDNGYVANGIENRDRYYMKRVYLSLVRALDLLTSLPEWDGKNVVVQGGSQGGALSIVAAGLDKRVTQCIVNHPALSDVAGYTEPGRTGGWPHMNRTPGLLSPGNVQTLAYYDVVNFARHVSCEVYMTWGYNDDTCPPTTSYAVWNVLNCPKEALITPVNEHWTSEPTERGQCEWALKHLIR